MGLGRLQVGPRFQNDELVFAVDALENIVALIAGFLTACSSRLAEEEPAAPRWADDTFVTMCRDLAPSPPS